MSKRHFIKFIHPRPRTKDHLNGFHLPNEYSIWPLKWQKKNCTTLNHKLIGRERKKNWWKKRRRKWPSKWPFIDRLGYGKIVIMRLWWWPAIVYLYISKWICNFLCHIDATTTQTIRDTFTQLIWNKYSSWVHSHQRKKHFITCVSAKTKSWNRLSEDLFEYLPHMYTLIFGNRFHANGHREMAKKRTIS